MAGTWAPTEGQIAGLYDLGRTLGKGHFAVVKLARHVFTGERVAVKVIDKSQLDSGAVAQLLKEVCCMKLVQHPNVVRLYEVIDTHSKLYLILELGDGGDMFDHIMKHEGGLGEEQAKHYFAQIVHAISYCHQLHVVHRDLKPENVVFFQEQGVVKLTDFGFSNCFHPGTMLTTSCGSLAYSAPEILLGDKYDAPAVDVWSLGVILYMLVCGHPPFQEANDSETLTMILDCRYVVPAGVSSPCADLIAQMLQRDPKQRASLEQIENHPWLQGVDPSPASRHLLPLTSHRRVSEDEHEIILQTMMCGHIADRESIQEALEAKRYDHVTATYFLLAERILREKQEKRGLTHSLSQHFQSRRPLDHLGLLPPTAGDGSQLQLTPKNALASFAGTPLTSFSVLGEGKSSPGFHGCGQPLQALLQASLLETAIAKSTLALQQISEEDEPDELDDEGKPSLFRRRTSSLNQEQMSHFQSTKGSPLVCRALTAHYKMGKSFVPGNSLEAGPEGTLAAPQERRFQRGEPRLRRAQQAEEAGGKLSLPGAGISAESPAKTGPQSSSWASLRGGGSGGAVVGLGGGERPLVEAGDRSSPPLGRGPAEEIEERDPRPQSSSASFQGSRTTLVPTIEAKIQKLSEGPGFRPPRCPKACGGDQSSSGGGQDGLSESIISLDPARGKSASLRERLLQFPLCEKALAFRMQPAPKEKLLSLGQFNCCHVI